jgi:hypothetical protein
MNSSATGNLLQVSAVPGIPRHWLALLINDLGPVRCGQPGEQSAKFGSLPVPDFPRWLQERSQTSLRSDSTSILLSFLLLSGGSYVPAPPAQPSCGRQRAGCLVSALRLFPPTIHPLLALRVARSVGHSYAKLPGAKTTVI